MVSGKQYVPDTVGRPLTVVLNELTYYGVSFVVQHTEPPRNKFALCDYACYVLRQRTQADGTIHLTAGAKMAPENISKQEIRELQSSSDIKQ